MTQAPEWAFFIVLRPEHQTEQTEKTMSKHMTGAEMVVEALKDQGVDTIFGYPGGSVLPIYDALFQQETDTPGCVRSHSAQT